MNMLRSYKVGLGLICWEVTRLDWDEYVGRLEGWIGMNMLGG